MKKKCNNFQQIGNFFSPMTHNYSEPKDDENEPTYCEIDETTFNKN